MTTNNMIFIACRLHEILQTLITAAMLDNFSNDRTNRIYHFTHMSIQILYKVSK